MVQLPSLTPGVTVQLPSLTLGVMVQLPSLTPGVMVQLPSLTLGVMVQLPSLPLGAVDPASLTLISYNPKRQRGESLTLRTWMLRCGNRLRKTGSDFQSTRCAPFPRQPFVTCSAATRALVCVFLGLSAVAAPQGSD